VEISGVLVEQTVRSGGLGDEVMGIDLAALSQRWGVSVAPFVLQATDGANVDWLPAPLPEPDLSDGPHLGYALQWFAFTLVGVVGYPLAMANVARRTEEVA
jgi:surfeit locus 1 family protein